MKYIKNRKTVRAISLAAAFMLSVCLANVPALAGQESPALEENLTAEEENDADQYAEKDDTAEDPENPDADEDDSDEDTEDPEEDDEDLNTDGDDSGEETDDPEEDDEDLNTDEDDAGEDPDNPEEDGGDQDSEEDSTGEDTENSEEDEEDLNTDGDDAGDDAENPEEDEEDPNTDGDNAGDDAENPEEDEKDPDTDEDDTGEDTEDPDENDEDLNPDENDVGEDTEDPGENEGDQDSEEDGSGEDTGNFEEDEDDLNTDEDDSGEDMEDPEEDEEDPNTDGDDSGEDTENPDEDDEDLNTDEDETGGNTDDSNEENSKPDAGEEAAGNTDIPKADAENQDDKEDDTAEDTAAPEITITGIENGKSYRDEVSAVISYSDTNYSGGISVKLYRTNKDEVYADVTEEFVFWGTAQSTQGGTFAIGNFARTKENDGVYTLIVICTDSAGNTAEKEINFTLNRFGSVYVYSEDLTGLIADGGGYVKSTSDKYIVITEYNPDKLIEGSFNIQITKDGKAVDDVVITVNPVTGSAAETEGGGWYQYEYIIDTSNFAQDGIYKITVQTEDEAGNSSENAYSGYEEILFQVDNTAPEIISVTGLEEAAVNAKELVVNYAVYDTMGLEKIEIYVDGILIQTVSEDDFGEDISNYSGSFTLYEKEGAQSVRIVATDMAGNVADTDDASFSPAAYTFNRSVTLSSDTFSGRFAAGGLFLGGIAACTAIAAIIIIFILHKKRRQWK